MYWIALKMLTGDRSKYWAIIFGITFACAGESISAAPGMQAIYAIDPANPLVREKKVLVGQLLDVFIDVK